MQSEMKQRRFVAKIIILPENTIYFSNIETWRMIQNVVFYWNHYLELWYKSILIRFQLRRYFKLTLYFSRKDLLSIYDTQEMVHFKEYDRNYFSINLTSNRISSKYLYIQRNLATLIRIVDDWNWRLKNKFYLKTKWFHRLFF